MNLVREFIESAERASATAEVTRSNPDSLNLALLSLIEGEERVLLALSDELNPDLFTKFRADSRVITDPTKEQLKTTAVGITDAFCGIASTGSVCVAVTTNLTVPVSMLTRRHIVVLDAKTVVPRPRDVFSSEFLDGKGLQRSFSYITGPSATADMGPLVRGVHGPGRLHIIVLE